MTPEIRSKYDNSCSAACRKCQKQLGMYFHLIWLCPLIKQFWSTVQTEIENLLCITIVMDPTQCIFGISPFSFSLSAQNVKLLNIMLYAARLAILQVWLDVDPPTISIWYDKLLSVLPYEQLSHVLQATLEDFVRVVAL